MRLSGASGAPKIITVRGLCPIGHS